MGLRNTIHQHSEGQPTAKLKTDSRSLIPITVNSTATLSTTGPSLYFDSIVARVIVTSAQFEQLINKIHEGSMAIAQPFKNLIIFRS